MTQPQTAAFYVEKGGVGKTTSCAHIGRALAADHDVLLVDLAGKQNDLAMQFGLAEEVQDPDVPVSAIFSDNWDLIRDGIDDVIGKMTYDTGVGPDLIPSNPGLEGADNDLASVPLEDRFTLLREFLQEDLDGYDIVLIDLPGKESNIALNGLVAAEHVVAPLKPGKFEQAQLEKLPRILSEIAEETPVSPELTLVLPNAVDSQKILHQDFCDELQENYPAIASDAIVPNSANVEAAPAEGKTVFDMPDDELYSTGKRARESYQQAADELSERL